MFDLYQYLPRSAAARLARNGSQTSFIPDVFARAAEQIRRIPSGGRAASPTDRLTLRVSPPPRCVPPRLLCPLARAFALPATLVEPSRLTSSPAARHDRSAGIIRRVNGRRYCMQDQPRAASCTRTDAPRFRGPSPPLSAHPSRALLCSSLRKPRDGREIRSDECLKAALFGVIWRPVMLSRGPRRHRRGSLSVSVPRERILDRIRSPSYFRRAMQQREGSEKWRGPAATLDGEAAAK